MNHVGAMTERLSQLGDFFRFYRRKAGLKQNELAERVSVTKNTVSQIECGKQWPSMQTYLRFLDELDLEQYDSTKTNIVDGGFRRSEVLRELGLVEWFESLNEEELRYALIRAWEGVELMREMERRGLDHPFKRSQRVPLELLAPNELGERTKSALRGIVGR